MLQLAACRGVALSAAAVAVFVAGSLLPGAAWVSIAHAQAKEAYKYTGAASCGASNCHGSTKPKADYPKLNENVVWFQKDKHAKAFATLTNEKLKSGVRPSKIAGNLKIAKAETSDRCLDCHAVNVKKELRGPKFDISEGVHCDGCHGPAEKWLEPHAEKGWTHEQSVKVGMYDTKDLLLRADKCVSCHLAIDHELVTAGHPDLLAFELDTFSASMPPHWRDKGTWFGTRAWATGQAISLREAMKQLADRAGKNAPEKLLAEAWQKGRGHAAVFRHLLGLVAPDAQKALAQDLGTLADLLGKGAGDRAKIAATAGQAAKTVGQLAARIATREFDKAGTQALIRSIAGDGESISAVGIRGAEQAAMALDRLYTTYSKSPGEKSDKALQGVLDKLFGDIEDPKKFDAKQFAAELKAFQAGFK
ncbi:MAG: hypothetical protein HY726_21825 [Candidatus Rokubacteria bacterium]|nr:hypothetical protein [Candidatus Rokubacteria bacterium]